MNPSKRKKSSNDAEPLLHANKTPDSQDSGIHPVTQVPPDLLLQIFLEVKDSCVRDFRLQSQAYKDEQQSFDDVESPELPVLKVEKWIFPTSHVCKRWRSIALDAPALWSYIQVTMQRHSWAVEMLKRSKSSPVVLEVDVRRTREQLENDVDPDMPRKALEAIREALPRCVQLRFYGLSHLELDMFFKPGVSLTRLQLLRLHSGPYGHGSPNKHTIQDTLMPQSSIPALRHLSIQGYNAPTSPDLLCQITHLRLREIANKVTLPKFLSFVSALPCLESLDISNAYTSSCESYSASPKVSLPRLTDLRIFNTFFIDTFSFLSSIALSSLKFLKMFGLVFVDEDDQVERYQHSLKLISSFTPGAVAGLLDPTIRSIRFLQGVAEEDSCYEQDEPENHYFTHAFRGSPLTLDQMLDPGLQPAFDITSYCPFDFTGSNARMECATETLFAAFPTSDVVSLQMNDLHLERRDWKNIMAAMPKLETIFTGGNILPFFEALNNSDEESDVYCFSGTRRLLPIGTPIPALSTLCIYDMNFGESYPELSHSSVAQKVLTVLRSRQSLGAPLKEVVFLNSPLALQFADSDLEALRSLVKITTREKKFNNDNICSVLSYVPEDGEAEMGPEIRRNEEFN